MDHVWFARNITYYSTRKQFTAKSVHASNSTRTKLGSCKIELHNHPMNHFWFMHLMYSPAWRNTINKVSDHINTLNSNSRQIARKGHSIIIQNSSKQIAGSTLPTCHYSVVMQPNSSTRTSRMTKSNLNPTKLTT